MRAPAAAAPQSLQKDAAMLVNTATVAKTESAESAPRVRSYFPEALYINPEIITDQNGRASISIPIADSITTLAHGHAGLDHTRRAGQRDNEHQGLPRFLRRPGSARHAHPGRPGFDSRGGLQLLRIARRREPPVAAGRLVFAGGGRSREESRSGLRPGRRIAVHARSQADREIQTDALGPHERGREGRRHRGP